MLRNDHVATTSRIDKGDGTPVTPVPEPSTWALLLTGFGLVGAGLRSRHGRMLARAA